MKGGATTQRTLEDGSTARYSPKRIRQASFGMASLDSRTTSFPSEKCVLSGSTSVNAHAIWVSRPLHRAIREFGQDALE
jgi:hypothetical protein